MALYAKESPAVLLARARTFLEQFPRSAFLAQANEVAARGSFDLGAYPAGLEYARASLKLLPENPLLLVASADVEARQRLDRDAIRDATNALQYLEEFARPISVSPGDWPELKRRQQATAHFALGRAQLQGALSSKSAASRQAQAGEALASFGDARTLNAQDREFQFFEAIAQLSAGKLAVAERSLEVIASQEGPYAERALESLRSIYSAQPDPRDSTFENFTDRLRSEPAAPAPVQPKPESATKLSAYAGSAACSDCHETTYRNWAESGMAKMFRPYSARNIIGDFTKNNEFYLGEDVEYVHGRLNTAAGADRRLFARMVLHSGKHYFELRQSDGTWRSFPVDYTIGSKWQQAYATQLPNGQIHVLPIQYSVVEKRWLNYWRSLDGPGTKRSDPYNFLRLDDSTSYQEKCAVCHTSQLRNTQGAGLAADGLVFREPGIGCEMCHGPSANHIAAMRAGKDFNKPPLTAPVEFSRISNTEFVAICAQCHMQAMLRETGAGGELNYSAAGRFFQHNASVPCGEFTRKGFYKDGRFSQTTFIVEALERSKCYRIGKVSCGNRHDPHGHDFQGNQTSLRFKDDPDRMCVGCHAQFAGAPAVAAHTHHASDSEASRCVSCHMPRIMDALTFSARTHQIDDIPDAALTQRFGREESPNACLLYHKEKDANWVLDRMQAWKFAAGEISAASLREDGRR